MQPRRAFAVSRAVGVEARQNSHAPGLQPKPFGRAIHRPGIGGVRRRREGEEAAILLMPGGHAVTIDRAQAFERERDRMEIILDPIISSRRKTERAIIPARNVLIRRSR